MKFFSDTVIFVLLLALNSFVLSNSVPRVVYFPDPKNEGELIPAYINAPNTPKRGGNESDIHYYLITRYLGSKLTLP